MRNPVIEFDRLKMYFGDPYVIDAGNTGNNVVVYQPTIGDIIELGESKFYQTLNIFVCNTTSYRLPLWEIGKDWNIVSDFELFCMLYEGIDKDASKLIFGDLDFSKFKAYTKYIDNNEIPILWNEEDEIEINENIYNHFSQYLRNVFNIFPEEKITKDAIMKKWYINKDKRQMAIEKEKADKGKKETFSIQPIISACVNHPGFKYDLKDLRNVGVCEFYDSVKRLQIYESSTALMKGIYSGFVNGKEINPENYNFMRETN